MDQLRLPTEGAALEPTAVKRNFKATITKRKIKEWRSAAKQLRTLKTNYMEAPQNRKADTGKEHAVNTHDSSEVDLVTAR